MLEPTKVKVLTDHGLVQIEPEVFAAMAKLWPELHGLNGEQLKCVMKASYDSDMADLRKKQAKESLPASK